MEVSYFGPTGREIKLLETGSTWNRALAYAGIVGLVGSAEANVTESIMAPGAAPISYRIKPMTGELVLHITSDGTVPLGELEAELRREFRGNRHGTLVVSRGGTAQRFRTKVRLNGAIEPPVDDLGAGYAEVRIPLISDAGVWDAPTLRAQTYDVLIPNPGDTYLWPQLEWVGEGEEFRHHFSGTWVPLPATEETRIISLNPAHAHEARDDNGVIDEDFSQLTKHLRVGYGVAPGDTWRPKLTPGAALMWTVQYLDPWR